MKNYNRLQEIRYSEVTPEGWLRDTLTAQKEGMPGNLHHIGYPFDRGCWKDKSLTEGGWSTWWPYEQTAYWIDSMVRTSGLLGDGELYAVVKDQVDAVLHFRDPFIGPDELREQKRCYRWPTAVLARALYARWSFTGEEAYLRKLQEHYLNDAADYSGYRDIVNVETILRLYGYYGDERLREKAVEAYEKFDRSEEAYSNASSMLSDIVPLQHGVTYNEHAKLAALMYSYTGERRYLEAAVKGYDKLERHAMLPDGVHAGCEFTYGNETKWAHESCDIADYTWSMGYLLEATGSSRYADRIERAVLNGAFGAIGPQFRTIQYFSEVNQVIAARNSTNIEAFMNSPKMAWQPHHYPECCVANIGRVIPNYVLRMYQKWEGGICVSLYGDSVYDGEEMKLTQTGGYPFGERVNILVHLKRDGECRLKLRIPYWAEKYTVWKNGKPVFPPVEDGYTTVLVRNDDRVELLFQKEFRSGKSPEGGIYFEYGPFLLALKIREKWEIDRLERRQTKEFPAYNLYPASSWSYCVNGREVPRIRILEGKGHPYWDGVPFEIRIRARILHHWDLVKRKIERPKQGHETGLDARQVECGATEVFEDLLLTPELPDAEFVEKNKGDTEEITLVPYGCTNLRLTVFPAYYSKQP